MRFKVWFHQEGFNPALLAMFLDGDDAMNWAEAQNMEASAGSHYEVEKVIVIEANA